MIQVISPRIFVELGTHSGNSYFSFCQSVIEAGISSKCYAVDTWKGDEHASYYDEEVFTKVSAYHEEHYAGFSRLLRMTFDNAVIYFSDESVNLFTFDGLHTYEAVRHDFETWLPKLAPGAVVMFHDTNVHEQNFGVWKLWAELQAYYPNNLEFLHSHGLGVLQLNNASDNKEQEWLQPSSPKKQKLINYFTALGSRQLERFELSELKLHTSNLNQALVERDGQIASLNQAVAERDAQIINLNQAITERDGKITSLNQAVAEREGQIANLNQVVAERDESIAKLTDEIVSRGEWALELDKQLKEAQAKIVQIISSNSWKITLPLREVRRWLTNPSTQAKRHLSGAMKLAKAAYLRLP